MNSAFEKITHHVEPLFDVVMSNKLVIGLINLSTDIITEHEFIQMLPAGVSIASTRIKTQNPITIENLTRHAYKISEAGSLYDPIESVKVFIYACTSGSALISHELLEEELHKSAPGAKLTTPMRGALRAFRALEVNNIAMLTPYPDEVTEAMAKKIETFGFSVVKQSSFHINNDYEIGNISPESILTAAQSSISADADALFIPCTALRTSSVIEKIEEIIQKPVITAHQAMLWDALRISGFTDGVPGFGKLLMI